VARFLEKYSPMKSTIKLQPTWILAVSNALLILLIGCGGGGGGGGSSSGSGSGGTGPTAIALSNASAVWIDANTLVWPGTADASLSYELFYSTGATLAVTTAAVSGGSNSGDTLTVGTLTATQLQNFPQFAGDVALTVPATTVAQIQTVLTEQLAVVQYTNGVPSAATMVQIGPVLDAVYGTAASGVALGVIFDPNDVPTFKLWAPTATTVSLNVYATTTTATPTSTFPMTEDASTGIWSYTASDDSWTNAYYYTYTVKVYTPTIGNGGAIVTNTVTDPYSVTLNASSSSNSLYSMVANLADASNQPAGWPGTLIPTSANPTDSVIYELHVRDFSANDSTAVPAHVGKYLAFTDLTTNGMQHLATLAQAGLTHVHIMPAASFSSVDEANCTTPHIVAGVGAELGPEQQVLNSQGASCYNWGYDPFHYGAPQGSYSTAPMNGLTRIMEFREMVQALHSIGLRVIMDVVYNHTSASGQSIFSVLDEIVPGYYYRLNATGGVENNSCCSDTATERTMMAKLMTDTLLIWAGQYKVDGFRFDTMELIPKSVMTNALAAVQALTALDARGHTYFYGEGWTPPTQASSVFTSASQLNLGGTGIGTFNDRMRDGVRGGSPFDTGETIVQNQGFINGQCYDLNGSVASPDCSGDANDVMFPLQDRISVGLAGNLANFPLNATTTGAEVNYFGGPTGYTVMPQENIAYISVHDNETIYDISQYKHPTAISVSDTGRAQVVGLSLVALAEGVAFIHGGDDLLRSKSGDSNSYRSEDYFNAIFWDGSVNNWSVGLPPQNTGNNAADMSTLSTFLNSQPIPDQGTILSTSTVFQEFLKIRKSTDLFRLPTAAAINGCVSFPDQGAQIHGLIVEQILVSAIACPSTSGYQSVVVLYNASNASKSFSIARYANLTKGTGAGQVYLHPVQATGSDTTLKDNWNFSSTASTGTFTVPARTTGVFVQYN
jgi:pullulanase